MKKTVAVLLGLCLLLSGCSTVFDGSYHHEEPNNNQGSYIPHENIVASNYDGLCKALINYVETGTESGVISIPNYDQTSIYTELNQAVNEVLSKNPIAAWAVNEIKWELGSNAGQAAIAVTISYHHDRSEIRKVHRVTTMEGAKTVITGVLDDYGSGVQVLIPHYESTDFQQLVENYADAYPQSVMERPQVVVNIFPEEGQYRLVELKFTYQTNRDALRTMQEQVHAVFESATLYVSSYNKQLEKFEQLYSFLMEFLVEGDYQLQTSITPAYSLLRHGVGDKKAFATVYAAMCREAGLDCRVVTGTRYGEPWVWNLINIDGNYRHLDLLRCRQNGRYVTYTDSQMDGYVWDYSEHPTSQ